MSPPHPAADVVVLGEPLIEHDVRLPHDAWRVSGDAFNVAGAAAAAGGRVVMLTALGGDRDGDTVMQELQRRGVDTRLVRRGREATGRYTLSSDLQGERVFTYQRSGSAAATMSVRDWDAWGSAVLSSRVLVTSGITAALSPSCRELVVMAVREASEAGVHVVFDVNFRPSLTSAADARSVLDEVAPHASLVKVGCPDDSIPVLGSDEPEAIVRHLLRLAAAGVIVTCGRDPLLLAAGEDRELRVIAVQEDAVDTTGAGDVLVGNLAAGLAAGRPASFAIDQAMAAAAASTTVRGGAPVHRSG